jgi:hypothetical protein
LIAKLRLFETQLVCSSSSGVPVPWPFSRTHVPATSRNSWLARPTGTQGEEQTEADWRPVFVSSVMSYGHLKGLLAWARNIAASSSPSMCHLMKQRVTNVRLEYVKPKKATMYSMPLRSSAVTVAHRWPTSSGGSVIVNARGKPFPAVSGVLGRI